MSHRTPWESDESYILYLKIAKYSQKIYMDFGGGKGTIERLGPVWGAGRQCRLCEETVHDKSLPGPGQWKEPGQALYSKMHTASPLLDQVSSERD